jgi:hypothetical protein
MATTTKAWELVHEQHTPIKQAACRVASRNSVTGCLTEDVTNRQI